MRPGVEFHPAASSDLLAAVDQRETNRPGSGQKFLDAVDRALERLALWPESGAPENARVGDALIRSVRLPGTQYRAVYLVTAEKLWVLAVAHDRQQPGFWQDRMDQ